MTDIPEDIMQAARAFVASIYIENEFPETSRRVRDVRSGENDEHVEIQACARAILAERRACEEIARDEAARWLRACHSARMYAALGVADLIAERSNAGAAHG